MPRLTALGRERRAEFEDFDVLRLHEGLELSVINRPGAGRGVVTGRKDHIMDVKAGQARGERCQVPLMLDEAEVLLDLRVARVVPISNGGAVKFLEQLFKIAVERDFLERLAIFDAQFDPPFFRFGQDLLQRGMDVFHERLLFGLELGGGLQPEFFVSRSVPLAAFEEGA